MKIHKILLFLIPLVILIIPIGYSKYNDTVKNKEKTIEGTIIYQDNEYMDFITLNDIIYRLNYTTNYSVGDNIKVYYKGSFDCLKNVQEIEIKGIEKIVLKSTFSDEAIEILNNMTLEEKIGQLLLVRVPYYNKIYTIQQYHIGGYLLFRRDINYKSKNDLINEISEYQSSSKIPLYIAIDEEGGTVSRLSYSNIYPDAFLSPQQLYNIGGYEKIKEDSINKSNLLSELGINLNLAPVADMTTNPNSYMYNRSFGKGKDETSEYIKTIASTQNNNVSYVLKHFPGYGDNVDTHLDISVDNRGYEELLNNDFIPFKTGVKNGIDAILVSHNIVTNIDNKPSSISRIMHNIIRNDLNFNGIITTDNLGMNAIKYYSDNSVYIDAVLAGNNVLIVDDCEEAYNEIYNGVINNTIPEVLLDRLVIRNIEFKIKHNIYK